MIHTYYTHTHTHAHTHIYYLIIFFLYSYYLCTHLQKKETYYMYTYRHMHTTFVFFPHIPHISLFFLYCSYWHDVTYYLFYNQKKIQQTKRKI